MFLFRSKQVKRVSILRKVEGVTASDAPDERAFREKQQRFYAMVGQCILRFQHVEDYLGDVFASVLGGGRLRADATFASVRGIDRKIEIIKAAATGLTGGPWNQLSPLLNRVKEASDVRGQIAHANPVQNGGLTRINVRTENGRIREVVGVERVTDGRWQLHKKARQNTIFTEEDLLREYNLTDSLFGDMIAFVKSVQSTQPGDHRNGEAGG